VQLEAEPFGEMAWILVRVPLKLELKLMMAFFLELAVAAGQRTNFDVAICTETESIGAQ